jgi:Family of unknown function (DUF6325)
MGGIGPVEYVVIAFPGNRFKGEIVPAVKELEDNGIVHILDVVFIKKDTDGAVSSFEYDGLDDVLEYGFEDIDGEAGGGAQRRGPPAGGRDAGAGQLGRPDRLGAPLGGAGRQGDPGRRGADRGRRAGAL